jgi:hypothetical protein
MSNCTPSPYCWLGLRPSAFGIWVSSVVLLRLAAAQP